MSYFFGVIVPYAALTVFITGFVFRIVRWSSAPVPFRIPSTCGQQKSFPWIKNSSLDNPHSLAGVFGRMALEILFFRSLFRNTRTDLKPGSGFVCGAAKWLWIGSLAFHWSLLIVVLRHLRFFTVSEPYSIALIQDLDSFFGVGIPAIFATDVLLLAALVFLFFRRILNSRLRYISLAADYIPLLLIGGIAVTGILMRHIYKVDLRRVKELAIDLVLLQPSTPAGIGFLFYVHLFLVCVLIAYFPISKLMHMGGIFLSPTRNLANNNRVRRHINPWNYDVSVHTYEEYEDEFRPLMIEAGLPVEKNGPIKAKEGDQV